MGFVSLISKLFMKKGLLPILGVSLLLGTRPYKTEIVYSNEVDEPSKNLTLPNGDTQKEKFLNSLSDTQGVEGTLDLTVSFKDKGNVDSTSYIKVEDASLKFAKPNNNVFALDLDMNVDYNGISKSAKINYVDDVAYINLDNLKYKYSDTTYKSVISKIISIFGVDAIKVPDSFYDLFDSFENVNSDDSTFDFIEENSSAELSYVVKINDNSSIHFEADSSYNLTRIYSDKMTVGNAILNFDFLTTRKDDELTEIRNLIPLDESSYQEMYDSMDLLRKIHNIASSERFGISLDGTLHHDIAATNHHGRGEEEVKLDMSLFADIKEMNINGEISALPADDSSSKNEIHFVSEKDSDEQKTYINYNDVMKVAVTDTTLNDLMARIKDDFSTGFNIIDEILNLLDENFVSNIKKGRYQDLLGCLKSLSNDAECVVLTLNLGTLGLGDESEIIVKADVTNNNKIATITLNNVGLSGFYLNDTTIEVIDYQNKEIETSEYYFLDKIPTIYDQIYDIYSSPKFYLSIEGSFKDGNNVGLSSIKGSANLLGHSSDDALYEFDGGYVDLELTERIEKTDSDGNFSGLGAAKRHHVSLDLDKLETAYFHYYDADLYANNGENGTLGKISIEPFQGIIDIVKEIYNSNDERFSKWFKVVEGAASSSVIDALKTGKYSPLLGKNLIVSSEFASDHSKVVLSGEAFGFNDGNISNNFSVSLKYDGQKVKSISVNDLVFSGKTLNLTITISDYIEDKLNIIDHDTITTDFTGLSPLISDLYKTSNLKTFHLTAENLGISLSALGLSLPKINLDMDFHIFVDGSIVKVYGIINMPCSLLYTNKYYGVSNGGYRTCVFYYDDVDPETGKAYEDNSGYAYLTYNVGKEKNQISGGKHQGAYKYHSSYFQDIDNLVHFIFEDIIDLKEKYYSSLAGSITKSDSSGKAINYEKLLTSFAYDEDNRKWDLGIAIDVLLNDDTLNGLTTSIYSERSSANNCYVVSKLTLSMNLLDPSTLGGKISGTLKNVDLDKTDNWSSIDSTYQTYIDAHRNDALTY